jgi:hypothetical protein
MEPFEPATIFVSCVQDFSIIAVHKVLTMIQAAMRDMAAARSLTSVAL